MNKSPAHRQASQTSQASNRREQEDLNDREAALVNKITTTGTNVLYYILLTHVGDLRGKSVVDLGCGNGRGTLLLSSAVGPEGMVLASDVSAPMVETARENLRVAGAKNVEYVCADCRDLRYIRSGTCDAVISNLMLHLVSEPEKCVAEVMRILKPGGVFALSSAGSARSPDCFMKAMISVISQATGDAKEAEAWLAQTNEQGSVSKICKLLCDGGFHNVFGWEQDVAICVNSIAEATMVIKSNAFTRGMVPEDKRLWLDQAVHAWAYSLFSSMRQPMFGSNCFKACKPLGKRMTR